MSDIDNVLRQSEMLTAHMQVVRETPKICKDCKHYRLNSGQPAGSQHRCNRPLIDLVTGESKPHDAVCAKERLETAVIGDPACGREGHFWEPRV